MTGQSIFERYLELKNQVATDRRIRDAIADDLEKKLKQQEVAIKDLQTKVEYLTLTLDVATRFLNMTKNGQVTAAEPETVKDYPTSFKPLTLAETYRYMRRKYGLSITRDDYMGYLVQKGYVARREYKNAIQWVTLREGHESGCVISTYVGGRVRITEKGFDEIEEHLKQRGWTGGGR